MTDELKCRKCDVGLSPMGIWMNEGLSYKLCWSCGTQ